MQQEGTSECGKQHSCDRCAVALLLLLLLLLLLQVEEGDGSVNPFTKAFDSLKDKVGGMLDKAPASSGRSSNSGSEKQAARGSRSPRWSLLSSRQDNAPMLQPQQQQQQVRTAAGVAPEQTAADDATAAVVGAGGVGDMSSNGSSFCTRVTRSTSSTTGFAAAESHELLHGMYGQQTLPSSAPVTSSASYDHSHLPAQQQQQATEGADLLRRRQAQAGNHFQPLPLLQLPPASLAVLAAGQPSLSHWTHPGAAADTPTLLLGSVQPLGVSNSVTNRGSIGEAAQGAVVGCELSGNDSSRFGTGDDGEDALPSSAAGIVGVLTESSVQCQGCQTGSGGTSSVCRHMTSHNPGSSDAAVEPAAAADPARVVASRQSSHATAAAAAGDVPHSSGGRHNRGLSWGEKIGSWARNFGSLEPPGGSAGDGDGGEGEASCSQGQMQPAVGSAHRRSLSAQLFDR
jgi:hypothetical protein